jgi:flagellar hook-associated protein FlgK
VSLALALNNALSGLRINQQSIGVLSQNIANVNTSGYSRQVLNQSALMVDGVGSGVRMESITRKIDVYLQRSVQSQGSTNATAQSLSTYYDRLQGLLGQPGSGNSIDGVLTGYFNAVQQLAETPETNSLKANAVSSGSTLARQISDLAANVYDLRYEADRAIGTAVTDINSTLDRLKDINVALSKAQSFGQSNSELLDERDKELRKLSEYMSISPSYTDSGTVNVVASNGVALLEDGARHQLVYTRSQSANALVQNAPFDSLSVVTLNDANVEVGNRMSLISGGTSDAVVSGITGGSLAGLQQIRDQKFPAILDQLDQLASRLRDAVNAIHNNGTGFPAATSLSGDRQVRSTDQYSWAGSVRIAVLQPDGKPVTSRYADEQYTGIRPLTLDLSRLDSGQGAGKPTMQTIVDEINNHFGAPGNKATLGVLNNIQLGMKTDRLPSGAPSLLDFDLDLENISSQTGRVFVTDVTVRDDTAADITNVTQTAPSISVQSTGSYTTTAGSADVVVNLASSGNFAVGDKIYLNAPSGAVNGISAANLTGFFTITAVSGTAVTITAGANATATGGVNDAGNIQAFAAYQSIAPGVKERTGDKGGVLQVDLSGSPTSAYYDVTVNVSVVDDAGVVTSSPITYRVPNNATDQLNKRFDARAVGGAGTLVLPGDSQESLRAILVDANGTELPTINGRYIDGPAYLKIIGGNSGVSYGVAIQELDSKQLGKPDGLPAEAGTNRGFSHYFGLNNFYASNDETLTGDTLRNSAYNLQVEDRLLKDPNLIATGTLSLQEATAATGGRPVYTYARYAGENSIAQQIAKLNTGLLTFDAAGGLPVSQQSLQGYTSDLLGFVSQRSSEAMRNWPIRWFSRTPIPPPRG